MNHTNTTSPLGRMMAFTASVLLAAALSPMAMAAHSTSAAQAANATAAVDSASMIGDFEGKSQTDKQHGTSVPNGDNELGWGWAATDDGRAGGQSTASIALVHPGAAGTQGALQATGEIKPGFIAPWAGAIWFPGTAPMQPADLSAKKELVFWVRGTPGEYSIMLMAGSPRNMPEYASFQVGKEWKQVHIPLDRYFHYTDMKHVYFVAFSAAAPNKFQFQLDQVQLR